MTDALEKLSPVAKAVADLAFRYAKKLVELADVQPVLVLIEWFNDPGKKHVAGLVYDRTEGCLYLGRGKDCGVVLSVPTWIGPEKPSCWLCVARVISPADGALFFAGRMAARKASEKIHTETVTLTVCRREFGLEQKQQ